MEGTNDIKRKIIRVYFCFLKLLEFIKIIFIFSIGGNWVVWWDKARGVKLEYHHSCEIENPMLLDWFIYRPMVQI